MWDLIYEIQFQETALLVVSCIFVMYLISVFLGRNRPQWSRARASARSWLFLAPLIFLFFGLSWPYTLIILLVLSIYGAKNFFQMTGMYHRSNFVWFCYLSIASATYFIYKDLHEMFNLTPVIVFLGVCLIPLIRNSYKRMVQYIALTLLNFCFIWAFLHLGWVMQLEDGVYVCIYIILLTEFFDSLYLGISRSDSGRKTALFSNITSHRSLEGFVIAGLVTLCLGWSMRHLLPSEGLDHWGLVSLTCIFFGSTGDIILCVVRRDLGIKLVDSFILGRGDFFRRLDRLVFVAPTVYYVLFFLGHRL